MYCPSTLQAEKYFKFDLVYTKIGTVFVHICYCW